MPGHPMPIAARIVALALMLAGGGARADMAPPEIWSDTVETVVVSGAATGPAIWRVRRGDSQVWILGTVGLMPKALSWNKDSLVSFMAGARQLLLPPTADVGLVDVGWFYLWHGDLLRQPRGQSLEASLDAPLKTRFAAARKLVGKDEDRYATDIPLAAAMRLQGDFREARELAGNEPRRTVEALARKTGVKTAQMGSFDVMPMVRDVVVLPQARQRACLEQAVADVERQAVDAAPAAEAWADGKVAAIKAHYAESKLMDCAMIASQKAADIRNRTTAIYVDGVEAALKAQGKSITLMPIGVLLRKGGVLDQLALRGAKIESPSE